MTEPVSDFILDFYIVFLLLQDFLQDLVKESDDLQESVKQHEGLAGKRTAEVNKNNLTFGNYLKSTVK